MQKKEIKKIWRYLLSGCLIVSLFGIAYRLAAQKLDISSDTPVFTKVPFADFPYEISYWRGTELPISETILKVANNDDYISRRYWNIQSNQEVTLYLAYTVTPVSMEGHRPRVCYVGSGWVHESTKEVTVDPLRGKAITCLIHRFRKPMSSLSDIYVLNYYIVSGNVTTDHRAFSGLRYRRITQSKHEPRYVAQIQISSISSDAAESFAKQIAPMIWDYLPARPLSSPSD